MNNPKIIFILHNIFESVNGVSTKYIKFIDFLNQNKYDYILFSTFKDSNLVNKLKDKFNIEKAKGLNIPFYKEIKIPIIQIDDLKNYIKNGNEIIIFNGEFIWLYNTLKKLKKIYKNLKIYPTMHTDYVYYNNFIYKKYNFSSLLNVLNNNLEKKKFNGIVVTGEKMKKNYEEYTSNIFNANEVNLDIYNNFKKDEYNNNSYNIIYCGRISKEKNIEEILDCCSLLYKKKYDFLLHIIGEGPFKDNLSNIIDLKYSNIKKKIIFHGLKSSTEIISIYNKLDNRIFLFTSISETFGKTPMEAAATGIPIFIKKNEVSELLYLNKKNAFIFEDKNEFLDLFEYFINLNSYEKEIVLNQSLNNIKKYDQKKIFEDWIYFLINGNLNRNNYNNGINFINLITFSGISKLINCSGNLMAD